MGFPGRATFETLAIILVVFVVQSLLALVLPAALVVGLFALDSPLPVLEPWTLITSVYAHGGPGHLLGNAVMLVLFGLAVERVTTRWRFHAFFVTVGALAGVSQVLFGALVPGGPSGVVGASGAILGLLGYLVAGNVLADKVVRGFELDAKAQLAAVVAVGAAITLAMAGPGIANVGHFSGLLLGLLAGRLRLLHVDRNAGREPAAEGSTA